MKLGAQLSENLSIRSHVPCIYMLHGLNTTTVMLWNYKKTLGDELAIPIIYMLLWSEYNQSFLRNPGL